MAEIDPTSAIDLIHGKLKKSDPGYFYVRNGKTYSTSWAWKFNSLIYEYKQSHPFAG